MAVQTKANTPRWARSLQRVERPATTPVHGHHRGAAVERGSRVVLKKLPKGFADHLHEQHVLTTPGVAEGFDRANEAIEDWKQSL